MLEGRSVPVEGFAVMVFDFVPSVYEYEREIRASREGDVANQCPANVA